MTWAAYLWHLQLSHVIEVARTLYFNINDIKFYHVTLVELADNFKWCLKNAYKDDSQWKRILNMIRSPKQFTLNVTHNEDIMKWSAELHFTYWNDLIYYINNVDECKHLCISFCFEKKIFELAYDQQHYDEFHCIYDWIFSSLFLWHLIRWLKKKKNLLFRMSDQSDKIL